MNLPTTRYYGSKRKLVDKIWSALESLHAEYDTVLDLFGGTGLLSYYMVSKNKSVIYNDIMQFNCAIADALLCTRRGSFTQEDANALLNKKDGFDYHYYIRDIYDGIYYTPEENTLIDVVTQNIEKLPLEKQSSAYYMLFQSCMIKRPFNIFHRKNLNLRENHVESRFGNKRTWEQPFDVLFGRFVEELNRFQFETLPDVQIINQSALNVNMHADLVYLDTPYFAKNGSTVTYHNRYHFLEGLMNYEQIPNHVNDEKANKEMNFSRCDEFEKKATFMDQLHQLLVMHHDSILAMSYTSSGYPSIDELRQAVRQHKEEVHVVDLGIHPFALNRNNEGRKEVLIVGM